MIKSIQKNDTDYPALLKELHEPPQKLYYVGNLDTLKKTCISVVGTRSYTDYGEFMTNKIIEELAILDIAIVSGLAKGIDAIAHKAALENNIPTIAVLGNGLKNIYPTVNLGLAQKIIQNGLLLSEYEPEIVPLKYNFPQRNRIVSGLSIATIVVEAPEKSGALITARLALEQGREIFVVPGDADRKNSKGIIQLIQSSGAYPICCGEDVIEVLKIQPHLFPPVKAENPPTLYKFTPEEAQIFNSMQKRRPTTLEQIAKKTTLVTEKILSTLSILEIKGLISTKDGKYLRKC
jgi:DNA processing protein